MKNWEKIENLPVLRQHTWNYCSSACLDPLCCLLVAVTVQALRVMSKWHPWGWGDGISPCKLREEQLQLFLASGFYCIAQQFLEPSCGIWRLTKQIWIWTKKKVYICKSLQTKVFLLLAVSVSFGLVFLGLFGLFLLFTFGNFHFFNSDYFSDLYDQLMLKRLSIQCNNLFL